jgi:hypothetical protein
MPILNTCTGTVQNQGFLDSRDGLLKYEICPSHLDGLIFKCVLLSQVLTFV